MTEKAKKTGLAMSYAMQRHAKKKMAQGGEVRAGSSRPTVDSKTERSMDMLDGPTEHEQEQDARKESMSGIGQKSSRSMQMTRGAKLAHGGELSMREEGMDGIDDARSERSSKMISGKSTRHDSEMRAATKRPVADDRDGMEMGMIHESESDEMDGAPESIVDAIRRKKYAKGGQVDLQESNGDTDEGELDELNRDAAEDDTYYDLDQLDEQPRDSNLKDREIDEDEHDMVSAVRRKMKK